MDASEYLAVSLGHAIVRVTRDVALARANHEALIKRMPLGQHPGIGRVSGNVGTLAASLPLEAVLYHDDKQFFMLCFSVSAHCSTSGCFRLQGSRSHLVRVLTINVIALLRPRSSQVPLAYQYLFYLDSCRGSICYDGFALTRTTRTFTSKQALDAGRRFQTRRIATW